MEAVAHAYDGNVQMIDSSSLRVHQHAVGAKNTMMDESTPRILPYRGSLSLGVSKMAAKSR